MAATDSRTSSSSSTTKPTGGMEPLSSCRVAAIGVPVVVACRFNQPRGPHVSDASVQSQSKSPRWVEDMVAAQSDGQRPALTVWCDRKGPGAWSAELPAAYGAKPPFAG